MEGYLEKVQELLSTSVPFVSVTLVDAVGSAPQDAGSKMLVTADGLAFGTVGGGRVEAKAIDQAKDMRAAGHSRRTLFVDGNLQTDVKIARGGDAKAFDAVHCPMGLELGINQPYEIALSTAAQVVQVRDRIGAERPN